MILVIGTCLFQLLLVSCYYYRVTKKLKEHSWNSPLGKSRSKECDICLVTISQETCRMSASASKALAA